MYHIDRLGSMRQLAIWILKSRASSKMICDPVGRRIICNRALWAIGNVVVAFGTRGQIQCGTELLTSFCHARPRDRIATHVCRNVVRMQSGIVRGCVARSLGRGEPYRSVGFGTPAGRLDRCVPGVFGDDVQSGCATHRS